MIFVTLGSQKFQFNRLLKKIDELILGGTIVEDVFAQIGYSDYKPQHMQYNDFMNREDFGKVMKKSNVVITHGGTGAIITAVKAGKRVIAVPRLAQYKEHVDNHQVQILKEFDDMGLIAACYDVEKLESVYRELEHRKFNEYMSNTKLILDSIDLYIEISK